MEDLHLHLINTERNNDRRHVVGSALPRAGIHFPMPVLPRVEVAVAEHRMAAGAGSMAEQLLPP